MNIGLHVGRRVNLAYVGRNKKCVKLEENLSDIRKSKFDLVRCMADVVDVCI